MATFDAFALAAAVARETRRVSIWVGPLALAVRDPVSLALGVTSVSILGRRPAHLALGSSTATVVRGWHGRKWGGNVRLAIDTIERLRPLLRGERSPEGFRLRSPLPGSQIGLAAFGPEMVKVASRLADRLVLNLLTPAQVAEFRARTELPITIWVPAALDPGADSMLQVLRELKVYLAAPAYAAMFRRAGLEEPDAIASAVSAMGSPARIRERVAEYHSAGATTVALVPVTAEDPGGARLLSALGGES
jgi:alkanesulfonate monooxygenase SsuD/methylene tetrahydromethanopterin reductase-like flavin-dependent oxidoreductase (luciferase family)